MQEWGARRISRSTAWRSSWIAFRLVLDREAANLAVSRTLIADLRHELDIIAAGKPPESRFPRLVRICEKLAMLGRLIQPSELDATRSSRSAFLSSLPPFWR